MMLRVVVFAMLLFIRLKDDGPRNPSLLFSTVEVRGS
jgi:hypothetical protein